MRSLRHVTAHFAVVLAAAGALVAPAFGDGPTRVQVAGAPVELQRNPTSGAHMLVAGPQGGIVCRDATPEEAASLAASKRADGEPLHVIKGERANKTSTGLTIVLRATNQLEGFPLAKNSFIQSATEWESLIASPITVVVDVDFGPKRFGQNYEPLVIGSTDTQDLVGTGLYPSVRSKLISGASSASETALYNTLPSGSVPTDLGSISTMSGASANLRALGLIPAVANPDAEQQNFGDPPSIGFNSAFTYDFNPSNGIDFDKTDFNAVVLHELGHMLGFDSEVGSKELFPNSTTAISVLDLFRFRPGVTSGTFTSSGRVLSSGGTQIFFAGGNALMFSTGKPDGSGGDGEQASHWKDDADTGVFIGLMDPTIGDGQIEDITDNDIAAFDLIGYRFSTTVGVTLANLVGDLQANTLTITGFAQSTNTLTTAEVSLLGLDGQVLSSLPTTSLSIGSAGSFSLVFDGLDSAPGAVKARLLVRDNEGGVSAPATIDFSTADSGAPTITKAKIKGTKLKLTGTAFTNQMTVEVNGVSMPLPAGSSVTFTGKKAKIDLAGLPLQNGANRFRLLLNGDHSNILVITT